jgi:lipopolysaccharide transport system ATP-binding protein
MRRAEIQRKFDEIVAFAEIERFLDTPVKRYSSGMYVRLAFAVAAHLEPEILVVDEVLAVGDAAFQKKCLSKMSSVAESGRTIVFVSHNLVAVQSFCDRLVWLDHGRVVAEGKPADLIPKYLKASGEATTVEKTWSADVAPGSDDVNLRRVAVRSAGKAGEPLTVHTPLVVEVDFQNGNASARIHVTLNLLNAHGLMAFETASLFDPRVAYDEGLGPGLYRSTCSIPGDLLNAGGYTVRVVIVRNMREVVVYESEAIGFEVGDSDTYRGGFLGTIQGVLRPKLDWTVRPLLASTADALPDQRQVDRAETPG